MSIRVHHAPPRPAKTRRDRIRRATCVLLLLYLATALGCAAFQRRMLYYPTVESPARLDQFGKARGLERWKDAAGYNIGWKRTASKTPSPGQVLITHGNGGCAVQRSRYAEAVRDFMGMDVFILEYPGFGDRPGSPSETALFSAAENAFESLPKTAPVYLLGESLGTGVAAYLAGRHPAQVAGVLLFAPYNRLEDVAQYHVRIVPARWLLREHFRSDDSLTNYHGPVAIVVGGNDLVVPPRFGRRLFDGYGGPKQIWEIPRGTHESIVKQSEEFWKEVGDFWRTNSVRVQNSK